MRTARPEYLDNGHQDAGDNEQEGGRRRRRRGRRGGRRNRENRQERNGNGGYDDQPPQTDFAPNGDFPAPQEDRSAIHDDAADYSATSSAPEPAPVIPQAPMPEPEAPRRRSTVREPAPVSSGESFAPTPSPAPAVTPVPEPAPEATEDANKPRRTGWWSKRFGG
jgi:ribonuclease E